MSAGGSPKPVWLVTLDGTLQFESLQDYNRWLQNAKPKIAPGPGMRVLNVTLGSPEVATSAVLRAEVGDGD